MIHGFGTRQKFDYERWVATSLLEDGRWLFLAFWKRIALFAILGLAGAAAYNRWNPQEYVSRATVRFIPPQVAEAYVSSKVAMQVEQRISAVSQLATSRLTATQMIETFGLYPQRRKLYPIADLVPEFQKRLKFSAVLPTGADKFIPSILISFSDADPNKAQQVVQKIVELVYEENRRYRADESIGTTDFLDQELRAATTHIQELEEELARQQPNGGEDKEYRTLLKVENLNSLERRLSEIVHEMSLIQNDRNLRKSIVSDLEAQLARRLEKGPSRTPAYSGQSERLRTSLAAAELAYENARRRYKPNYPDVLAAQEYVNQLQGQLATQIQQDAQAEEERDLASIREPLNRAKAELAAFEETMRSESKEQSRLSTEITRLRRQFEAKPAAENKRLELVREYDAAKLQYSELARHQHESHLASEMERRGHGEVAELVEPPTVPPSPEKPTELMLLAAGAFLGLLVGYCSSLMSFFGAPMVRIPRHISLLGDYPILVKLPRKPLFTSSKEEWSPLARSIFFVVVIAMASSVGCGWSTSGRIRTELTAANQALKTGDYRVAELRYRKVIELDARNGEAHSGLATTYLAIGNPVRAYEQLIRAAELLPGRVDVAEQLTDLTYQIYFANPGRPVAMLRELEARANRLMKTWPARPSGFRFAGQVLVERHRDAEAIELIEHALERIEDGDLRTQLASIYFQKGDRDKAENQLRRSIQVNPTYIPAYDLLYLQLMERGQVLVAREILENKYIHNHDLGSGLQLAAHDDAMGRRNLAAESLERLGREFGSDPEAVARIGDFWLNRGEFNHARRWYEDGLARNATVRGLYAGRLAELLLAEKNPSAAQALVDRELSQHPKDLFMRAYHAAFGLDSQSDTERRKMQAELESVLVKMPNSPFVRLHLGRAYLLNGDALRAGELFRSAITLDPNYAPGWLALADVELRAGKSSQAQDRLQALLRRTPNYAPARLLQAQVSLAQNKPAEADEALSALLADDPENVDVMLSLARAKIVLGQRDAASRLLARVEILRPKDPQPILLLARMKVEEGHAGSALEGLRAAQQRLGNVPEIASMLGSVALVVGQSSVALNQFEQLVKRDGDNLQFRLGYASSLALAGMRAQAQEQFEYVQKRAGNNPEPWLLYGAMMSSAGNTAAAHAAYQEVLKRDARNPYALNNLAFLLARRGEELDHALEMAEEARRVLPHSPEIGDTLAYIYLRKGMKRNAAATLEELAANLPNDQAKHTQSLLAQIRRGDLQGARAEMEKDDARN